jgi:hypothetical protein
MIIYLHLNLDLKQNIIKLLDLFWKRKCIATIWLGIRIHDMTGNISQLSQTNPTCFFARIKFLNWSYFITYGCGLDEISALEIIFNNLLLQHWGQILSKLEFYIVASTQVSYNYCFKVGRYFNDYYFICQNLISAIL